MTTASLTVAALVALASGQGAGDRQAYGIHQERLAALVGPVSMGIPSADAPAGPSGSAPAGTGCLLVPGGSNLATPSDCLACHASHDARLSHPVDVHRDSPRSRSLRSSAEVVRRGVFLADGKVTCLSCHDGNSSWKHKIALPPGAALRPRVKPGAALRGVPRIRLRRHARRMARVAHHLRASRSRRRTGWRTGTGAAARIARAARRVSARATMPMAIARNSVVTAPTSCTSGLRGP